MRIRKNSLHRTSSRVSTVTSLHACWDEGDHEGNYCPANGDTGLQNNVVQHLPPGHQTWELVSGRSRRITQVHELEEKYPH